MSTVEQEMINRIFIGGKWVDSAASGATFEVINPATGETLATLPDAGREEMQRAIDAAAGIQSEWQETTAQERAQIMQRAARLMHERKEHLARVMTLEQGKPLAESRGEIVYAASFVEWFAEEGRRVYGDIVPSSSPDKRIMVIKRPVGVTAAITPWNFPAAMITRKCAPALAAGCTMVIKPSELTPLSALEMARIFEEAGLPEGVLSIVCGLDAAAITSAVMEDRRVRKLSFTGSTPVGKLLMKQAADTMKRLSLELGGHAPFIVFEDADMEAAVEGALASKMRNMGQTCVCANRIYVQRSAIDEFSKRLIDKMSQMKVGDGLEEGVEVGPLIEAKALEKVERHVADAKEKGATVALGGERVDANGSNGSGGGAFYAPTVLTDVDDTMLVTQEETFGPVAALIPFDTEEEVVRRANNTVFGLSSYFFTRDVGRVMRLGEQLEYGIIGANDGMPSTAQAPFGGLKESGFGREGGHQGIEEYLDTKYISLGGVTSVSPVAGKQP
ncbi:MAG: NAD-dependent succinate-semialdehyde dehydrogenase [Actinomycetota bacterium]|nr:NAD-dependent succinate-semialdehyde dehydrogenase [Actinomycetota bacterium]